jgi:hypothetical protein
MSESGFELGLDQPDRCGVFFVTDDDLDALGVASRDAGLAVRRIDLGGCGDRPALMLRTGSALDFPAGSGRNWDALSDRLRDLSWLEAPGYALLLEQAGDLREADERVFDTLLDVLEEAAAAWRLRGVPFWAFLAMPMAFFDALDAAGNGGDEGV